MRIGLILSLMAVGGCASSGGGSAQPSVPQTVRVSGGGTGGIAINTVANTSANVATVAIPLDRVWRVLPQVYDSIAVPVNTVDLNSHTFGNTEFKLRRQLGKVPLNRYINCGNAQGPPSADTYEIELSVLTTLAADDKGGTTITTVVESSGRPVTLAGEFSRCSSRGVLEPLIVSLVNRHA
jgi:hypothetical protein